MKMINHGWTVLCERSITDRESNNISLINCIEQLNSIKLPAILGNLTLTSFWYKEDLQDSNEEELEIKAVRENPEEKNIKREEEISKLKIKITNPRQRINMVLNGLPFPIAGTYYFRIDQKVDGKWRHTQKIPILVYYTPPEMKPTSPS